MRVVGIAFALGVAAFHLLTRMPDPWQVAVVVATMILLAVFWRWLRVPAAFAFGAGWACLHACQVLCAPFPETLARQPLVIEGRIVGLPAVRDSGVRFLFRVEHLWQDGTSLPWRGLARLTWYRDAPGLRPGERWRLPVRLKPPHGFANPGGFDYERWLFEQGVQATGSLRAGLEPERLGSVPGAAWLTRLRQWIAGRLADALGERPALGVIQALTIGERAGIEPQLWEVFTRTGTNHLMAISGLHVGLIAGAAFLLVRRSWSLHPRWSGRFAAPRAAALGACIAALGYAALAGFAISTQRALIMLAVVLGAVILRRTLRTWHALILALAGVLLLDPQALLSPGFWLSFGAVAVLLLSLGQRPGTRDWWSRWGKAQWAIAVGLSPLLLWLFARASVVAPLVNLLAVPLFSLVLLPLVLMSTLLFLLTGIATPLLWVASLLEWCVSALGWVAQQPWAVVTLAARPLWAWGLAGIGVFVLLAPRGLPGRWLGLLLWLPLIMLRPPVPGPGAVWVSVLDVGQGLAVVVRTHARTLLFDTGPGYPGGFNAGRAVILPWLRERGVERIDHLMVSHADRDHAGGLASVLDGIEVGRISSGEPGELEVPGVEPCRAGEQWMWSGVRFRILHPADSRYSGNDASCVLQVSTAGAALLLTGDASTRIERLLLQREARGLRSDLLVAGHHGSATSSSEDFLVAVAPRTVVFSAGYANQYGFPAAPVRARVRRLGIATLNTACSGELEWRLSATDRWPQPRQWRREQAHPWTHRPRCD